MALASQYNNFRATSNPVALGEDACLHYVTSLVSVKQPGAINKHLSTLARQVKKKKEDVLSSIEDGAALFQEVETTLAFLDGGGSYLPNLDDNLVVDKEVTMPILHVVQFDPNGKIQQIRLHWDQAVLLKSIGVMGVRATSWPIAEGQDQVKLIKSSVKGVPGATTAATRQMEDVSITSKPVKKRDPSVDLFTGRDADEDESARPAPKGALKPHDRPLSELFVGDDSNQNTPVAPRDRSTSSSQVVPKAGAGKNYHENRLFGDGPDDDVAAPSPAKVGAGKSYRENRLFGSQADDDERQSAGSPSEKSDVSSMKPHPDKFTHFDFYDGHDEPVKGASKPRPKTKHQSQWDFADFATPAKPVRTRGQSQGAHHFSFDDPTLQDSPMKGRANPPKARRDAESHFELQDDGGDASTPRVRPSAQRGVGGGSHHKRNESTLWQSQGDEQPHDEEVAASRASVHNPVSQKNRNKDFGSHWDMTDDPPAEAEAGGDSGPKPLAPATSIKDRHKDFDAHWAIDDENPGALEASYESSSHSGMTANKAKALKTMSAQWESRDASPGGPSAADRILHGTAGGKENRGVKVGGDGMGGRVGSVRQWGFEDDGGDQSTKPRAAPKSGRRGAGERTEGAWQF